MKVFVKKLNPDIDHVKYANEGDAGIDLRASGVFVINLDSDKKEITEDSYELKPGERILIKTGIATAIPPGFFGSIRDRSGVAFKHGIKTLASVRDLDDIGTLVLEDYYDVR